VTILDDVVAEVKGEYPDFRIVYKGESALMGAIGWFLLVVTFGAQRSFMKSYVTTIGHTVYVPDPWDSWNEVSKVVLLRHERVHMRQQGRYGKVLFSFLYAVPFLPMFLSYFRARFELEAYTESIRANVELRGPEYVLDQGFKDWLVSQFITGAYGFMWPFRKTVERWVTDAVEKAVAERQPTLEKKP